MRRWKAGSTRSKPSWFTTPPMRPARRPSETCSPISKDTTTVSGSTPPSGTSPPNRQSFRPRNPVSTFSGEHHCEKGGVSRWVEACLNLPKERYAMTSNSSTVVPLCQSDAIDDPLTAILRSGARRLLAQAIEAEAETFLATMKGVQLPDGRERLVRHGLGPERVIQTGIGPVEVRRVKLRDRGASEGAERIRFTSSILPRWARRTPSLDALLPILYLRGVSMGDFQEALGALLGRDAPNP